MQRRGADPPVLPTSDARRQDARLYFFTFETCHRHEFHLSYPRSTQVLRFSHHEIKSKTDRLSTILASAIFHSRYVAQTAIKTPVSPTYYIVRSSLVSAHRHTYMEQDCTRLRLLWYMTRLGGNEALRETAEPMSLLSIGGTLEWMAEISNQAPRHGSARRLMASCLRFVIQLPIVRLGVTILGLLLTISSVAHTYSRLAHWGVSREFHVLVRLSWTGKQCRCHQYIQLPNSMRRRALSDSA